MLTSREEHNQKIDMEVEPEPRQNKLSKAYLTLNFPIT